MDQETYENNSITDWEDGDILYADDLNSAFTYLHNSIPIVLSAIKYKELKEANLIESDRIYLIAEEWTEDEINDQFFS